MERRFTLDAGDLATCGTLHAIAPAGPDQCNGGMVTSRQKIVFESPRGERLVGQLVKPPTGEARSWALFAHCFTCGRNIRAARTISTALANEGIGVLRFDFTGLGESTGDFADTNFSSNVEDLLAAAHWLGEHASAASLLVGHSLGGAAVLKAAAALPSVSAVATLAAPYDPAHVARLLSDAREQIEREGEAVVSLAGRPFRIRRQFLDDLLEEGPPAERLGRLGKALLVMHAPMDDTVSIDNASQIFKAAKHPKSFVSLDDADHLLSKEADGLYAATVLAAWASRFVPVRDAEQAAKTTAPMADGFDVVATTGAGYRTELTTGRHRLVADEPPAMNGTDAGPTPYGLLSSALASCTGMTLRMYADRKQIPLERVSVHVSHSKVHAQDCADCMTAVGRLDEFRRVIELTGELTDTQRQRLIEIADRCPVHRTLEATEVKIRTEPRE